MRVTLKKLYLTAFSTIQGALETFWGVGCAVGPFLGSALFEVRIKNLFFYLYEEIINQLNRKQNKVSITYIIYTLFDSSEDLHCRLSLSAWLLLSAPFSSTFSSPEILKRNRKMLKRRKSQSPLSVFSRY